MSSWVRITRVAGPGSPNESLIDGSLDPAAYATMKQKGVIGKDAYLSLTVFLDLTNQFWLFTSLNGGSSAAEAEVSFLLNGTPIGHPIRVSAVAYGPNTPVTSVSTCQRVDASLLRYARRSSKTAFCYVPYTQTTIQPRSFNTPDGPRTETTCPGINEVKARISLRWGPPGPNGSPLAAIFGPLQSLTSDIRDTISVSGHVDSISFRTMSPVVMVHGIRTDAKWFLDYPFSPRGPGTYSNSWFRKPFEDADVPYKSIDFPEDLIVPGGTNLFHYVEPRTQIEHFPIRDAADEFGAFRIHLIAHSKGGLWTRAFLANRLGSANAKLLVLSLTTVDTPHLGSYNADLAAIVTSWRVRLNPLVGFTTEQAALSLLAPISAGSPDLTTAKVGAFNSVNHLPSDNRPVIGNLPLGSLLYGYYHRIKYFSTSGDANLDNSCAGLGPNQPACDLAHLPTITDSSSTPDEAEGYEYPDPDIPLWQQWGTNLINVTPAETLYRQMYRFKTAELVACNPGGLGILRCVNPVPADNLELNDFMVTLKSARYPGFLELTTPAHNHTTAGRMETAQVVLQNIMSQVEALLP